MNPLLDTARVPSRPAPQGGHAHVTRVPVLPAARNAWRAGVQLELPLGPMPSQPRTGHHASRAQPVPDTV